MGSKSSAVLRQLLDSSEYSDFTLVCQGHEFRLHKNVVCVQSPMIHAALCGEFKEAKTSVVKADQFEIPVVRSMVDFLYTEDYSDMSSSNVRDKDSNDPVNFDLNQEQLEILIHHVQVNSAADYYQVPKLKERTRAKIEDILQSQWEVTIFPDLIEVSLSTTGDSELHELLAQFAAEHIDELSALPSFADLSWGADFTVRLLRCCGRYTAMLRFEVQRSQGECFSRSRALKNVERCMKKMDSTDKCPSCERDMNCLLEKKNCGHGYHIRCRGCWHVLSH